MRVEEFSVLKQQKVSDAILNKYPMMSYSQIQKLFRKKDIKVNDKRISADMKVVAGDIVKFFIHDVEPLKTKIFFEDENIIVVFKTRKIETVSETEDNDLRKIVSSFLGVDCYAVHRLDRNTEGLVVFAKNKKSKDSLDYAFKNRTLEKYYLALVYGILEKKQDNMIAYLKKYPDKSYVDVVSEYKNGYDKIQTNYKVLKEVDDMSLVEVELVTGKTHQIRAHFSHIGHFVIGDEKYGDADINKKLKCKYQNLCAYKIKFNFEEGDYLYYLNGMEVMVQMKDIDFCQNL